VVVQEFLSKVAKRGRDGLEALMAPNANGETPLFMASAINDEGDGRLETVKILAEYQMMNVNQARAKDGFTPLLHLACHGYAAAVHALLELRGGDIDVNQATLDGRTPLFVAAQCGRPAVAALLLEHEKSDVDVNKQENDGKTPLYIAASLGELEVLKLLLAHKNVNVNQASKRITPLYIAAQEGYVDIVTTLLQRQEIDIESATGVTWTLQQRDSANMTPLQAAALSGRLQCVQALLSMQARLDAPINYQTVLEAAKQGKRLPHAPRRPRAELAQHDAVVALLTDSVTSAEAASAGEGRKGDEYSSFSHPSSPSHLYILARQERKRQQRQQQQQRAAVGRNLARVLRAFGADESITNDKGESAVDLRRACLEARVQDKLSRRRRRRKIAGYRIS
jgi:ankyrin repeat protein